MKEPHKSGVFTWAALTAGQLAGFVFAHLFVDRLVTNVWFIMAFLQCIAVSQGVLVWRVNKRMLSNHDGKYIGRQS